MCVCVRFVCVHVWCDVVCVLCVRFARVVSVMWCVCGINLKYALRWHVHISVHSILCQCCTDTHTRTTAHTHTRIIKPFDNGETTGLKVDIAMSFITLQNSLKLSVTHKHIKGLKRTLFIRTKHNTRIFGVIPFFELQNT